MRDTTMTSFKLIADSYLNYQRLVFLYIYYKIGNKEEAEDLTQDVFLKLMDYQQMLRVDTIKFFIFTIYGVIIRGWRLLRIYMNSKKLILI